MMSRLHFSIPNSIPIFWLYILTVCIRVSSSFSFFANSLMSSMYIRWFIFSCDLLSLYPAVHFLTMWFSGIMAIMNCRGDSASPWKILLWIVFNWIILRWGFLIWESIFFIYCGLFVLILVGFFLCWTVETQRLYPPSGPVAQRIEALSLYGSRWALSEDSGFKSYPSRPEVYLVKNVVR